MYTAVKIFGYGAMAFVGQRVPFEISSSGAGGPVMLSFNALTDRSGASYQVLVSEDMNSWQDASPNITGTTKASIPGTAYEVVSITYTPPAGSTGKQFFRIQAKQK